jgi:hypothetical protein
MLERKLPAHALARAAALVALSLGGLAAPAIAAPVDEGELPAAPASSSAPGASSAPGPASSGGPQPATESTPEPSTDVQFAVRSLGWSFPLGTLAAGGADVTQAIKGAFPFILDLGGKIGAHVFAGIYLGFNPGPVGRAFDGLCKGDVTCAANNVRLGFQVQYHLLPHARTNPWVGYGLGFEAVTIVAESSVRGDHETKGGTTSFQGPELAHLSGGVDYRLSESFGFGPFVALTLGRYSTRNVHSQLGQASTYSVDPATHAWLLFGVRSVLFP